MTQSSKTLYDPSSPSSLPGARICVLEVDANRSIGFTIDCVHPSPFAICEIEKDSSAELAGLQVNDVILSVNGRSLIGSSYEDTIRIIDEALHQQFVQFVVNQSTRRRRKYPLKRESKSLCLNDSYDDDENMDDWAELDGPSYRGTTVVEEYQSNSIETKTK